MKNIKKLTNQFYFDKDINLPDINNYGKYRLGLSRSELVDYIHICKLQASKIKRLLTLEEIQKLMMKYQEIEGCNTCVIVDGVVLYYRLDVERFCQKLFNKKETYFD
jgi:hypothetical protein